jgi:Putative 2/3 transmembrane domain holin
MFTELPRMLLWALLTVVLMGLALFVQTAYPGNVFAVTLYKAHLMALGGWGGYWLDRALFPYSRPHLCLNVSALAVDAVRDQQWRQEAMHAMLRRAIIVAACLVCVGLGA